MKKLSYKRLLSLLLALALLAGLAAPAAATESEPGITWEQVDNSAVSVRTQTEAAPVEETAPYAATDVVRVSIVLEDASVIEQGYQLEGIGENESARTYRKHLETVQDQVSTAIEKKLGGTLDVAWNLTLAANIISANVQYGQISAIETVAGVSQVVIETVTPPMWWRRTRMRIPTWALLPARSARR
ncbi:MAG: hypothetical protein IJ357_04380 [Oscillospiraceae bacterium]|nr:hypothetical protein [Oscillospiraceae bacterium]